MNADYRLMLFVTFIGFVGIYVNYDIDAQRGYIRTTKAKTKIWGELPTFIKAEYKTGDG